MNAGPTAERYRFRVGGAARRGSALAAPSGESDSDGITAERHRSRRGAITPRATRQTTPLATKQSRRRSRRSLSDSARSRRPHLVHETPAADDLRAREEGRFRLPQSLTEAGATRPAIRAPPGRPGRARDTAGLRVSLSALSRARVQPSETLVVERKQVVTAELVRRSRLVQRGMPRRLARGWCLRARRRSPVPVCTAALSDHEALWLQVRPLRHSIFAGPTKS